MAIPPAAGSAQSTDTPHASVFGAVMIVMTLVGWSSVPLFLRHFAEFIDLWTSNGWRYGFSALLWAPVLLMGAYWRKLPKHLWRAAVVPSAINATGQVFFTWAHYKIDPGLLTFGLRSQIIFAAIGAYLMFPGERPIIRARPYLIGGALVLLGTSAAVFLADDPVDLTHTIGVTLAVLSGLFFAFYGLSVRKYMRGVNSVVAFAAISQYTAAAMVALMLTFGDEYGLTALAMETDQFVWLLISAVIGIALGHVFYYMSIARLGVAVSAGVLQLQPFGVAVGSYLLFTEVLTLGQWIGGCVAVSGAVLMLGIQRVITKKRVDSGLAMAEGKSGV
jgi:drug/metabolite transporter (DMT)-like permease